MTFRFPLPRWFLPADIGLGDIVKRGTAAVGIKPCAPCLKRAERLNQLVVLAAAGGGEQRFTGGASGASAGGSRSDGTAVEHLPTDEGTPDTISDNCCNYSVTLINKGRLRPWWISWCLWPYLSPWFQPSQVRVTALAGTTILDADPGQWHQVANLPNSVTWRPPTPGPIQIGNPAESWVIENDFLLSLGPVSTGVKSIRIEWLTILGGVLDVFEVNLPCTVDLRSSDSDDDWDTDWEAYTTVLSGGTRVFAYLEPDDCDPGEFNYRLSCSISRSNPVCASGSTDNAGAYSVTLTASNLPPGTNSYDWTINGANSGTSASHITQALAPSSYSVELRAYQVQNNQSTLVSECSLKFDLEKPEPHFSVVFDACTKKVALDASDTENANLVQHWDWECSDPAVQIPSDMTTEADVSALPNGEYDITLRVKDKPGCTWTAKKKFKKEDCSVSWDWTYSWCVITINPEKREDVTVSFKSTPSGCEPFTYKWDFNDPASADNTSTLADPTHTYRQARHFDVHLVTLEITDATGCTTVEKRPVFLAQRLPPQFQIEQCPDGKVIATTNEVEPTWEVTGGPAPDRAPWPYTKPTKKHPKRVIWRFEDGVYEVKLSDKNENGNVCETTKTITIHRECCTKNAYTHRYGEPVTVQVGGKDVELRVRGKLNQTQGLWHIVTAKTILERKKANGRWRKFRSPHVTVEANFGSQQPDWPPASGTVWRSESIWDGVYFTGCNCTDQTTTSGQKSLANRRRVRAVDGLGGRFRSMKDTVQSNHGFGVAGLWYGIVSLSLGAEDDCDYFEWWTDWY